MDMHTYSRRWSDFAIQYQGKRSPTTAALYYWFLEWANRCYWPPVFEMAPNYAMAMIGVKHHQPYNEALANLCDWGFVKVISKGANQHAPARLALVLDDAKISAAIASALSNNDRAPTKKTRVALSNNDRADADSGGSALSNNDRANTFAPTKNDRAQPHYTKDNNKQTTTTDRPITNEPEEVDEFSLDSWTKKLVGDRRVQEGLSRRGGMKKKEDRDDWIGRFALDQWQRRRLTEDRDYVDLLMHCQDWIIKKRKNEANNGTDPQRHPDPTEHSRASNGRDYSDDDDGKWD